MGGLSEEEWFETWLGGFFLVFWVSSLFLWISNEDKPVYVLTGLLSALTVSFLNFGSKEKNFLRGKILILLSGGAFSLILTLFIYLWKITIILSFIISALGVYFLVEGLTKGGTFAVAEKT